MDELMLRLLRRIQTILQSQQHRSECVGRFRGEALGCENPKDNKNQHERNLLPRNGGFDCVGARALSAGTFMNCWAIKTKTLRYTAMTAPMTYVRRHEPARRKTYRAGIATAKTSKETMPTACEGKNLWNGNRNPVTLAI
jgi:hypothetical protein